MKTVIRFSLLAVVARRCTLLDVLSRWHMQSAFDDGLGHRPFDGACVILLARSLGARERGQQHWQGARGGT